MRRRTNDDLAALDALFDRRERKLLEALREARSEVAAQVLLRDEQQERVDVLIAEIARNDASRLTMLATVQIDDIRLSVERRRWLLFDLGKERFFLDEAIEDLQRLQRDADAACLRWQRLRERRDALTTRAAGLRKMALRAAMRREEAVLDDRIGQEAC